MLTRLFIRYVCTFVLVISAISVDAEEIKLQHKGVTLNAMLELASGKKVTDGVVLITHGALAHRDMESITYIRKLFRDRGYNTMAINLSLGLNDRHGMYDCKVTHQHRNDDAVEEIGVWMDWLKHQGVKQVTLVGHSRGGAQTALYAVEHDNEMVKSVVLLAPATGDNTNAAAYQNRYNKPLAPLLEKAKILLNHRQGGTVLEHVGLLMCRDTPVTADSFVSYYGQDRRLDAPYLMPKIRKPLLVIVAGNDNIVVDLDKKVSPLVDGKRINMEVIEGADHLFRDLYADDAVDAIHDFLTEG